MIPRQTYIVCNDISALRYRIDAVPAPKCAQQRDLSSTMFHDEFRPSPSSEFCAKLDDVVVTSLMKFLQYASHRPYNHSHTGLMPVLAKSSRRRPFPSIAATVRYRCRQLLPSTWVRSCSSRRNGRVCSSHRNGCLIQRCASCSSTRRPSQTEARRNHQFTQSRRSRSLERDMIHIDLFLAVPRICRYQI